jgi:hypothetical protein
MAFPDTKRPATGLTRFAMPLQKSAHRKAHRRPPSELAEPLSALHDDQVLTFHEWCRLNGFSERTGRRELGGPDGPIVTQLSSRRIGVIVRNNRRWQESRKRG